MLGGGSDVPAALHRCIRLSIFSTDCGSSCFAAGQLLFHINATFAGSGDEEFAAIGEGDCCRMAVSALLDAGDWIRLAWMQGDEEREQELRVCAGACMKQRGDRKSVV